MTRSYTRILLSRHPPSQSRKYGHIAQVFKGEYQEKKQEIDFQKQDDPGCLQPWWSMTSIYYPRTGSKQGFWQPQQNPPILLCSVNACWSIWGSGTFARSARTSSDLNANLASNAELEGVNITHGNDYHKAWWTETAITHGIPKNTNTYNNHAGKHLLVPQKQYCRLR